MTQQDRRILNWLREAREEERQSRQLQNQVPLIHRALARELTRKNTARIRQERTRKHAGN